MNISVRAIIKKGDSVVFVEHSEKIFGTFFLFPGGAVEKGESLFQATVREVFEETSLVVKAEKIAYLREVEFGSEYGIELYVICEYISGSLEVGSDPELSVNQQVLKSARTVPIKDLSSYDWKPAELHKRLITDLENPIFPENIVNLGLVSL